MITVSFVETISILLVVTCAASVEEDGIGHNPVSKKSMLKQKDKDASNILKDTGNMTSGDQRP